MITTNRRRRFRWSLRTMFAAVTVAGILFGWLFVHLNWIKDRQAARVGIRAHRGSHFDAGGRFTISRIDGSGFTTMDGVQTTDGRLVADLPQAPIGLRLFGEKSVHFIVLFGKPKEGEPPIDFQARDEKLPELKQLFPEAEFVIYPPGSPVP